MGEVSRGIYFITAIALMISNLTSHSLASEPKDCGVMLDRCFQGCMSRGKTDAQIVTCGNHCQQVDYNNFLALDSSIWPRRLEAFSIRAAASLGSVCGLRELKYRRRLTH
jgi:hypothetical protein